MLDAQRIGDRGASIRHLVKLLKRLIRPVVDVAEHAALETVLVEHDAVVLVVSVIGHDSHDQIVSIRHLAFSENVIGECANNRRLSVAHDIGRVVVAVLEIRRIHGKALLGLGARELITRGLVEVRKGDHAIHDGHDGAGMDLHVGRI